MQTQYGGQATSGIGSVAGGTQSHAGTGIDAIQHSGTIASGNANDKSTNSAGACYVYHALRKIVFSSAEDMAMRLNNALKAFAVAAKTKFLALASADKVWAGLSGKFAVAGGSCFEGAKGDWAEVREYVIGSSLNGSTTGDMSSSPGSLLAHPRPSALKKVSQLKPRAVPENCCQEAPWSLPLPPRPRRCDRVCDLCGHVSGNFCFDILGHGRPTHICFACWEDGLGDDARLTGLANVKAAMAAAPEASFDFVHSEDEEAASLPDLSDSEIDALAASLTGVSAQGAASGEILLGLDSAGLMCVPCAAGGAALEETKPCSEDVQFPELTTSGQEAHIGSTSSLIECKPAICRTCGHILEGICAVCEGLFCRRCWNDMCCPDCWLIIHPESA